MLLFDLLESRVDLLGARTAPLYHGCALGGVLKIIATDTVEDRTQHCPRRGSRYCQSVSGVSMSRSLQVACTFGDIVLAFDQDRLRQRYRIVPQDFWGYSTEPGLIGSGRRQGKFAEAEEFVIGPITHAMRYVTDIFILSERLAWIQRNFPETAEPLLNHPLLRADSKLTTS